MQVADARRDLPVEGEVVAEPRDAEHRRVAGRREDGDGGHGHDVAQALPQPLLGEVGHDAQHRGLDPARRAALVQALDRQRGGGDQRDPDVRHDRREHPHRDQAPQAAASDGDLAGQP
jgi:hypothetical protein